MGTRSHAYLDLRPKPITPFPGWQHRYIPACTFPLAQPNASTHPRCTYAHAHTSYAPCHTPASHTPACTLVAGTPHIRAQHRAHPRHTQVECAHTHIVYTCTRFMPPSPASTLLHAVQRCSCRWICTHMPAITHTHIACMHMHAHRRDVAHTLNACAHIQSPCLCALARIPALQLLMGIARTSIVALTHLACICTRVTGTSHVPSHLPTHLECTHVPILFPPTSTLLRAVHCCSTLRTPHTGAHVTGTSHTLHAR